MEKIKLLQTLQKYPTLRALFKEEWFLRKLSEKREQRHLLIELLLEEENEREYIAELVSSLNDSLKKGKIKDFRKIDSKLTELLYYSEFLKRVEFSRKVKDNRRFH